MTQHAQVDFDFFRRICGFARYLQQEIVAKCKDPDFPIVCHRGVAASVLAAHLLVKSQFGGHPLAQPKYYFNERSWEHANNLALIEMESGEEAFWRKRPSILYEDGRIYKAFSSWGEFCQGFTDRITWTHVDAYRETLVQPTINRQIYALSQLEREPAAYLSEAQRLFTDFNLLACDEPLASRSLRA